jgi:hypothetical protein
VEVTSIEGTATYSCRYRVVQGDAQQCQSDTVVYRKAYYKTYRIVLINTGERMNVNGTQALIGQYTKLRCRIE